MAKYNNIDNLRNAISPYDKFCDGYGNSGSSGNSYILGLVLGVGKTNISFSHPGSQTLDEIDAFDLAEIEGPYIGQLNMSIVSSFCGPQGLIWGYDVAQANNLFQIDSDPFFNSPVKYNDSQINVFDARKLIDATGRLFGTVDDRKFVLRPGAHVPFAGKSKTIKGKGVIYSAIALGIPENRADNACLLLEDIGMLSTPSYKTDKNVVFENLAKSIIKIGNNQRVKYSECFVAIDTCEVGENQIGCALVAAPYFTLAKSALITDEKGNADYSAMMNVSLDEWEEKIFRKK